MADASHPRTTLKITQLHVTHVAPNYAGSSAPASSHNVTSSSAATTKQVATFAAMDEPPPAYEEHKSDPPVVVRAHSAEAAPAYFPPEPASPWAVATPSPRPLPTR